ncbi:hypothetical protein AGLY_008542 [Aphis glycines]|uniref:Uncharacterized protein n=1 Tax=Aphis glycines TaxID=307491 RepID=A0A6G0TKD9_APHGL|nr:hypothetical protein AGLY_008542 [Aphis glycines]
MSFVSSFGSTTITAIVSKFARDDCIPVGLGGGNMETERDDRSIPLAVCPLVELLAYQKTHKSSPFKFCIVHFNIVEIVINFLTICNDFLIKIIKLSQHYKTRILLKVNIHLNVKFDLLTLAVDHILVSQKLITTVYIVSNAILNIDKSTDVTRDIVIKINDTRTKMSAVSMERILNILFVSKHTIWCENEHLRGPIVTRIVKRSPTTYLRMCIYRINDESIIIVNYNKSVKVVFVISCFILLSKSQVFEINYRIASYIARSRDR